MCSRATPTVRVTFMLHLLLLVLLLKQSDAVNEECRELQDEISGLEEDITRITEQQHKYEQFFGQCNEQLNKEISITKALSRKLNESEAVNNHLQSQISEFKMKFEQSASVNNDLKKQLEAKEEVLRSKNVEKKQMQTAIDELTKTADTFNNTVQELCAQGKGACRILLEAAKSGAVNTVKILVSCTNDNCTTDDEYRETPLRFAVGYGLVEVVRVLLEGGANAERANANQRTALHRAACYGYLEVCRLLLDWGAKVDPVDRWRGTPLHDAARKGHLSVVKLLVERGADVRVKNNEGQTARDVARRFRNKDVADWLDSVSRG